MSAIPPTAFVWDGEAMQPRSRRAADEHFVIGQAYMLVEHKGRSEASHRHYFALVHEAWLNLPEDQAARFPTDDQLRKYALIRAGYRDETTIVCANNIEAMKVATFAGASSDFCIVQVDGPVVTINRPKSQSARAMGKEEFQASKDAVLGILAEMIGVEPAALGKHAETA